MKIESTNVFVGPSTFARFPVIRHVLDLGELEEWPTGRLGEAFTNILKYQRIAAAAIHDYEVGFA